jgi:hypothetical protein
VDGGEEEELAFLGEQFAAGGVDQVDAVDLVAEELDADGELLVGGPDLDGVAADAELAALELDLGALVLHRVQGEEELAPVDAGALGDGEDLLGVGLGRAEAEDAGDAGDDDGVAAERMLLVAARRSWSRSSLRLRSPSRCRCRAGGCRPRAGSSRSS